MATSKEYIEFVCESITYTAEIKYKKMFGEYMVYINEKPILLVCDNTVFIKKHPALDEVLKNAETGFPYDGAKEHYVLDIENRELVRRVIEVLEPITPVPVKRKKKAK